MKPQMQSVEKRIVQGGGRKVEEKTQATTTVGRAVPKVELSEKDKMELKRLEHVIKRHTTSFIMVGRALAEIRGRKLYLEEYDTFEEYCQKKWEFNSSRARQLIGAARIMRILEIGTRGRKIKLPTTERQIRPLFGFKPKVMVKILEEVVSRIRGGRMSSRVMEEVAAEHRIHGLGRRSVLKKPKTVSIKFDGQVMVKLGELLRTLRSQYPKGAIRFIQVTPIIRVQTRVSTHQMNLDL